MCVCACVCACVNVFEVGEIKEVREDGNYKEEQIICIKIQ